MKQILSFILFIFVINPPAWNQTYFNHRFEFEAGYWEVATTLFLQNDGYIIGGGYGYWETPTRLGIKKIDFSGNEIYTKFFFDDSTHFYLGIAGSICRLSDDTIIAVGTKKMDVPPYAYDRGLLYFFTNNFDTIKTCTYGENSEPFDTSFGFYQGIYDSAGFILLTGQQVDYNTGKRKVLLIKTDTKGNPVWEKTYTDGTSWHGYSVICTSDGGYAIGGYKNQILPPPNFTGDPLVIKTDSAGNMQWFKLFGDKWIDYIAMLCNSSDGNILVGTSYCDTMKGGGGPNTGEPFRRINILKLDNNGNVLWDRKYGKSEYRKELTNVRENPDGTIIACGITHHSNEYTSNDYGWLLKVDGEGDSLWYREYIICTAIHSDNWLYDVHEAPDKGYIACGVVYAMPPDTGDQDAWVIKVDSIGCVSQGECWVGIPLKTFAERQPALTIYPNPVAHEALIEWPENHSKEPVHVSVFDLFGRMVKETEVPPSPSGIKMDLSSLPEGIYLVKVSHEKRLIGTKKIVKY